MLGFLKNNRNNKMESTPIKIIDKGHYREITYGSEVPRTVQVLGASKEHEGMWVTSERDAKGVNVLISEHVLMHSYEAIDVMPLYTEGDRQKLNNKKSFLFDGIGEEFPEDENEIIENTTPTYEDINNLHHEIQNVVQNPVQQPQQVQVRTVEPQQIIQQKVQPNVVTKIDDETTFLHRKVVEKFILPNDKLHTNPVVFNLTTNVDIQKLINGMQLMDLDPEIVLEILLENKEFKQSLVQIFGGSFIKKTPDVSNKPVVANFTVAETTPIVESSIAPKIVVEGKYSVAEISPEIAEEKTGTYFVQVTGKQNYEEIKKAVNPWSKKENPVSTFIQPNVVNDTETVVEENKEPVIETIVEEPKIIGMHEVKPRISNMDAMRSTANFYEPKILTQEEINKATQLNPVTSETTEELLERVAKFTGKTQENI